MPLVNWSQDPRDRLLTQYSMQIPSTSQPNFMDWIFHICVIEFSAYENETQELDGCPIQSLDCHLRFYLIKEQCNFRTQLWVVNGAGLKLGHSRLESWMKMDFLLCKTQPTVVRDNQQVSEQLTSLLHCIMPIAPRLILDDLIVNKLGRFMVTHWEEIFWLIRRTC